MKLSKSAIGAYAFCPYQFRLKYIDKTAPYVTNPTLQLGTRFHEFAERFYDHYTEVPPEYWGKFVSDTLPTVEKQWYNWFIDYQQKSYNLLLSKGKQDLFEPIERENKLIDTKNRLVGIIDAVKWVSKDDGTVYIIEYKTSKKIDPFYMKSEIGFYASLWNENRDTTAVGGLVINPQVADTLYIPVTERMITKAKRDIFDVRKAVCDINLPRKCSDAKFAMCGLCNIEDVKGMWENKPFDSEVSVIYD